MKRLIIVLYTLFITAGASAQFYATGDDPGRLKWYSMDTDNFRIIYPEGNDSLARVMVVIWKFSAPTWAARQDTGQEDLAS